MLSFARVGRKEGNAHIQPNIMYDSSHPAHGVLGKIGREVTTGVRPKAVVVISAHWEAGGPKESGGVEVNFGEGDGLIYE